jgi:DNA-binding CsgD family transcriptional regulator
MMRVADHALVEREDELARIGELAREVHGGSGCLLVVEGPAGIGKTRLLAAARARVAPGMLALSARGGELEHDFAFGVVRQLFEAPLAAMPAGDRARVLSKAASLAAPLVSDSARGLSVDPARALPALIHGLYWLTSNLAAGSPLLIAVDDAHWADVRSLKWLAYLARRLEDLPVLVALVIRSDEPQIPSGLRALRRDPLAHRVELAPLSPGGAATVVRTVVGTDAADEFCGACHSATGGNPFLLRELLKAVTDEGLAPTAAAGQRLDLLHPAGVSRAVLGRFERLSDDATALAHAAAVIGVGAELRHAAALAHLDERAAAAAADALSDAAILGERPLEFVHPLVRSAVYDDLAPARRALMHAETARLLAAEGADPVAVGVHLLAAEPAGDPDVVDLLAGAAREALSRGAPESAASFLSRALAEPVRPHARAELLGELGQAELLARDPAAAGHLTEAVELSDDAAVRLRLTFSLAEALYYAGRMREAHELATQAIAELVDPGDELLARLETWRAYLGWGWSDAAHAEQTRARLPRLRTLAEDSGAAGRGLLIYVGAKLAVAGEQLDEALRLVERGLDDGRFIDDETADSIAVIAGISALAFADRLAQAGGLLERLLDDARRRGSVMGYAAGIAWRAFTALRRGSIPDAEADARGALAIIQGHELHFAAPFAVAFLVEALVETGELEEGSRTLDAMPPDAPAGTLPSAYLLEARARLRIAEGRLPDAVRDLRECVETLNALGIVNPNHTGWHSTLALCLPPEEAGVARALVETELTRALIAGQPRAIGVALRAKARLEHPASGPELLRRAAGVLERCPSRLEQARTLADLGAALRRLNRRAEAREPLRRAVELAYQCGATVLLERAREELKATGARPRRIVRTGVDALTPTERRIATMASQGMSNPEIAQALFVTRKTVEAHLGNAYRTLGISSRTDLPVALGARPA